MDNKYNTILSQYLTSTAFETRLRFFAKYSTSQTTWYEWVWNTISSEFRCDSRILEIGCGKGSLWQDRKIDKSMDIYLTDISYGMLEDIHIQGSESDYYLIQMDGVKSSFRSKSFDIIIANHMMYHVPNRIHLIHEFDRLLSSDGMLFISTYDIRHLSELFTLVNAYEPTLEYGNRPYPFSLEDGVSALNTLFDNIEVQIYEDSLVVDNATDIMIYILTTPKMMKKLNSKSMRDELHEYFNAHIRENGPLIITANQGIIKVKNTRK